MPQSPVSGESAAHIPAYPKSISLIARPPSAVYRMFSGFTSRWTMFFECRYSTDSKICAKSSAASSSGYEPFSTIRLKSSPPDSLRAGGRRWAVSGWVGGGGGGVLRGGGGGGASRRRQRQRGGGRRAAAHSSITMYVLSAVATTSFSWTMCGWLSSRRILISVSSASRFSSSVRSPFSTTLIA